MKHNGGERKEEMVILNIEVVMYVLRALRDRKFEKKQFTYTLGTIKDSLMRKMLSLLPSLLCEKFIIKAIVLVTAPLRQCTLIRRLMFAVTEAILTANIGLNIKSEFLHFRFCSVLSDILIHFI